MSSRGSTQIITIAASVLLSVAATLAATTLVYDPTIAAPARGTASTDDDRVDEEMALLRSRIAELEEALADRDRTGTIVAAGTGERASTDTIDLAALEERVTSLELGAGSTVPDAGAPSDVEAVVEEMLNERELAEQEARRAAQMEKLAANRDALVEAAMKRLHGFAEDIGLADWQLAEIEAMASELTMDYLVAQADGASDEELGVIVRDAHRETQRIMGDAMYRDYRVAQYNAEVEPKINWVMGAVGGDDVQRQRMHEHWQGHADRTVDRRIQLDTEEMSPEERARIEDELTGDDGQAWSEGVESILTPEQRGQIESWGK